MTTTPALASGRARILALVDAWRDGSQLLDATAGRVMLVGGDVTADVFTIALGGGRYGIADAPAGGPTITYRGPRAYLVT